jgi:hypothetical protein
MALYVIDDRLGLDPIYNGNSPINSVGILWKVKDNLCSSPIINENWQVTNKNYLICATRSNGLITVAKDGLARNPNNICSDKYGNLYTCSSIDRKINKIDIDNNISTIFNYPTYYDKNNNSDVGGYVNNKKEYDTNFPDLTSIESIAVDDNNNIYVILNGSYAIYKISSGVISKLCGQPSDTFLGPNELLAQYNQYKDGNKDNVLFYSPKNIKYFNNYLYILDNDNRQLRRIDLNGNVKTINSSNYIVDFVVSKNGDLYFVSKDLKLRKINLNFILGSASPELAAKEMLKTNYIVNIEKESETFGEGDVFSVNSKIILDDREQNLYTCKKSSQSEESKIIKINLTTSTNNTNLKAIAFAGENSIKRQGDFIPGKGIDIKTRDFYKNISIAFRTDKIQIISPLNVEYEYNEQIEYNIIAEGMPTKYSVIGNLPNGLVLNNDKIIGSISDVGEFSILLSVEKEENNKVYRDTKVLNIKIKPKIISSLEAVSLVNGEVEYNIEVQGSATKYEAKLKNGSNINTLGLDIDQDNGVISGILNQPGTYEIEIKAKFNDIEATKILKLYFLDIISASNVISATNELFSYEIKALGEPDTFEVDNLHSFLNFDNSTKKITGILNAEAGQTLEPITLKITKNNIEYTKDLNISVAPRILNSELEIAIIHNQNYNLLISYDNNGTEFDGETIIIVQNLPNGLSFNQTTKLITGKITSKLINGKYTVIITATRNNISSQKNIILKIPPLISYDGNRIQAYIEKKFSYQVDAPGAKKFIAQNLPIGLKINQLTGLISGMCQPRHIGSYNVQITCYNDEGQSSKTLLFYVGANFTVRVFNKTAGNIYYKMGHPQTYSINDTEAPIIYLEKGKTYIIDQLDPSNSSNPLNIYFDPLKNKKLDKYITIKGSPGVDRLLTINIPKEFKSTKTLYYMSENNDYFGGEIKIISKEYKLKHNIKLLCFGAQHNGSRYFIPNKLLSASSFLVSEENSFISSNKVGVLALLSTPTGGNTFESNLYNRKDTLSVNLVKYDGAIIDYPFSFDYFGQSLNYTLNPTGKYTYEFKDIKQLYDIVSNITFSSYNSLDEDNLYQPPGYKLSYCPNCVSRISLTTGLNNMFSGDIQIYYNPTKIINDYTVNKLLNINQENIETGDFVFFNQKLSGIFKYEKEFYSDENYQIERKL